MDLPDDAEEAEQLRRSAERRSQARANLDSDSLARLRALMEQQQALDSRPVTETEIESLSPDELIRRQGLRRTVEDVELATLAWVHWWNTARLHQNLCDISPAEFEANHYAQFAPVS